MEVRDRIAKIIASEGLTASAFADKIGIQRSNVSHILNGRNNPSLELLQKILTSFPKYNTEWLVMGRGEIYRQPVQTSIFDVIGEPEPEPVIPSGYAQQAVSQIDNDEPELPLESVSVEPNGAQAEPIASETPLTEANAGVSAVAAQAVQRAAEVKQIVVLYTDNTFSIYNKQ